MVGPPVSSTHTSKKEHTVLMNFFFSGAVAAPPEPSWRACTSSLLLLDAKMFEHLRVRAAEGSLISLGSLSSGMRSYAAATRRHWEAFDTSRARRFFQRPDGAWTMEAQVGAAGCLSFAAGWGCGYAWRPWGQWWKRCRDFRRERRRRDAMWLLPSAYPVARLWASRLGPRLAAGRCGSSLLGRRDVRSIRQVAFRPPRLGDKHCPSSAAELKSDFLAQQPCLPCTTSNLLYLPRRTFSVLYHTAMRTPVWCGFFITSQGIQQAKSQRRPPFTTDVSLPLEARCNAQDLRLPSGFHRGHLAPHASVATSEMAAVEAALLSNIVPQHGSLNLGAWKCLENATRDYVCANPQMEGDTEGAAPLLLTLMREGSGSPQRSWWRRILGTRERLPRERSLAICTGPLFQSKQQLTSVTAAEAGTPPVPAAMFMAAWDPHTHDHVAFIVPNNHTKATSSGKEDDTLDMLSSYVVPLKKLDQALQRSISLLNMKSSDSSDRAAHPLPEELYLFPLYRHHWRPRWWRRWLG